MSEVKEEKSHFVFSLQNKVESIAMSACLSNNVHLSFPLAVELTPAALGK